MANKLPFQTRDQFQSWVVDGRQDHVSLLTSRLLLRNVPHIGRVPDRETLDTSLQQAFAAAIFRNAMLCWTASTWGEPAIDEGQVLVSLRWAAGATEDFDPSYHPPDDFLVGSFLTRLATDSANSFLRDDPIECLFSAVDAAMKVGSDSFGTDSAVWNMIALDASLLDEGMASGKVAIMPLWPSGNPFWFDAAVRSMSAKLLALDNAWSELLAWYGARVTGGFMQGLGVEPQQVVIGQAEARDWRFGV